MVFLGRKRGKRVKRGSSVGLTREQSTEELLLKERSLLGELQTKLKAHDLKLLEDVLETIKKKELSVPVSAIADIHPLEGIVLYLKQLEISFTEIASLLNRSYATIYTSYRNALKRRIKKKELTKEELKVLKKLNVKSKDDVSMPISALGQRPLSILEAVVFYLKQNFGLRYHDIAVLLNRDDRTIWTVYQRAKNKQKKQNKYESKK